MPRIAALLALALILLAPAAAAFPSSEASVDIAYATGKAPMALLSGKLDATGDFQTAFISILHNGSRIGAIPSLNITHVTNDSYETKIIENAKLTIHQGTLFLDIGEGIRLPSELTASYGLAAGFPRAPFGGDSEQDAPPGLLMASHQLEAIYQWPNLTSELFILDGIVTILDSEGNVVEGWDRRHVNEGLSFDAARNTASGDGSELPQNATRFSTEGSYRAALSVGVIAGSLGTAPQMDVKVAAAEKDGFRDAANAFARFGETLSGSGGGGFEGAAAFDALAGVSGILNGAILLVKGPTGGDGESAPLAASLRGEETSVGSFALLRSRDLHLAWDDQETRVQGTSSVAVTSDGFAVEAPARVGFVPLMSAILWFVAAGSVIIFLFKRPPKARTNWLYWLLSLVVNLLLLAVVFYFWDGSFAETFGTSFLTHGRAEGFTMDNAATLGTIFGLQMLPWGLAALFFALPVRIALGIGLRYLGKGKSFSGVATAGGTLSLGILGPLYALWLLDLVIGGFAEAIPRIVGG